MKVRWIKPSEIVLIIFILYVLISVSFFWYAHWYKTGQYTMELNARMKWEQDVTNAVNKLGHVMDYNLKHGKLVTPSEEKK